MKSPLYISRDNDGKEGLNQNPRDVPPRVHREISGEEGFPFPKEGIYGGVSNLFRLEQWIY